MIFGLRKVVSFYVLGFLCDKFSELKYVDPANTNNIISADLSSQQKRKISVIAEVSRKQKKWEGIVW